MTQKTLPSKFHPALSLYRLSFKRTEGLTVLITVFSLLFCPGYVIMMIKDELRYVAEKTVDFTDMCPTIIFFTAVATTAIALLYLFINFSFLYGRSSSDFFHALPVKRGGLLFSRFFASVVPVLIPMLFVYVSMGIIASMKSVKGDIQTVIFGFAANVLLTVMCCAFSLVFIVCAGSVFDLLISFFTVNVGVILVQVINAALCSEFLYGFPSASFSQLFSVSSPFYFGISKLLYLVSYGLTAKAAVFYAAKLIIITAASLAAAFLLYNRRRSEKSGVSYAYRFVYVICGLIVGFIGSYGLGIIFSNGEYTAVYWIFAAVGGLLAAVTYGAITDRGFKSVKKSIVIGGSSFAAMVLAVIVLNGGLFGYTGRIPKAEEIKAAYISSSSDSRIMLNNPQNLLKLHEKMISRHKSDDDVGYSIDIEYELKNGRILKRQYAVDYEKSSDLLLSLYKSDEYTAGLKKLLDGNNLQSINDYFYGFDNDTSVSAEISSDELNLIVDAYIKDLKNATGSIATDEYTHLNEIVAWDKETGRHIRYQFRIEKGFKNTLDTINSLRLGERSDGEEEIYQ